MPKSNIKKCFECHSACNAEAPYCEACGYQFRRPVAEPSTPSRWKYRLAAVITGLVVAVAFQILRLFKAD